MRRDFAICGLLLIAVAFVFGPTLRYDFVNYDDNRYVYENPHVLGGFTTENFLWAFTVHADNWHPLSWMSLMLDGQLYGSRAWGYHLTNVLLHAATVIALYWVLRRMTAGVWPSALVAALFAIHPLRVESVAWVTERKDVLSGLLFMLTIAAYLHYVRRPSSLVRYLAVFALFILGLTAKPMLVTLPFVLLLLDYWPLGRMRANAADDVASSQCATRDGFLLSERLIYEKLPLLVSACAACAVTLVAQWGAVAPNLGISMWWRIGNALISYVVYLRQFFYPAGLAVLYPRLGLGVPLASLLAALVILVGITAMAWHWRRERPYFFVGWFWYVIMMVPVIGLVQVGSASVADRFTYLPQIGLGVVLAWGVAELLRARPRLRWACVGVCVLALAVLVGCARRQTSYWRNSETLWLRALSCTSNNSDAHFNLAHALAREERDDEAIEQYRKSLAINPNLAEAHDNLGILLAEREPDEAIAQYREALDLNPDFADAHNNLGVLLVERGLDDDAVWHYERALEIRPDFTDAHVNLGDVLAGWGREEEAIGHFRRALEIEPSHARAGKALREALAARETACGR